MGRKKKFENQPEVIVDAAAKLFVHYGFSKTTMDDIAKEVGIGKATLYGDFSSKEQILMAVIHRHEKTMLDTLDGVIRKSKSSVLETIHDALIKEYLITHDVVKQHHANARLFDEAVAQLGKPFQESRERTDAQREAMIADQLRKAIELKEVPATLDPARASETLFTALEGIFHTQYDHSRAENQRRASEILTAILSGFKTDQKL